MVCRSVGIYVVITGITFRNERSRRAEGRKVAAATVRTSTTSIVPTIGKTAKPWQRELGKSLILCLRIEGSSVNAEKRKRNRKRERKGSQLRRIKV